MNAKKYFLTIQYRLHRIDASDIVRMIENGGITIDDVPDALKEEVENLLVEKEKAEDGNDH